MSRLPPARRVPCLRVTFHEPIVRLRSINPSFRGSARPGGLPRKFQAQNGVSPSSSDASFPQSETACLVLWSCAPGAVRHVDNTIGRLFRPGKTTSRAVRLPSGMHHPPARPPPPRGSSPLSLARPTTYPTSPTPRSSPILRLPKCLPNRTTNTAALPYISPAPNRPTPSP